MLHDNITGMYGKFEVYRKYKGSGRMEKVYEGKNAISYRAKTVMARILAGGINPNTFNTNATGEGKDVVWGSNSNQLRIAGIALGNGGHLIYNNSDESTAVLDKSSANVVNPATTTAVTTLPALPNIGASSWGYASTDSRTIPGTNYEPVENGNIPWDGTVNITDNGIGVAEPNTTLYSETFRIPLDDIAISADGYSFPTATEVQFKATLDDSFLNNNVNWGFASQPANWISEAGLITGYRPDDGAALTGQIYSDDGDEPTAVDFNGLGTTWDTKDGTGETQTGSSGNTLAIHGSVPPTVTNGVDTWGGGAGDRNTWNMLARKTFPVVTKSSEFGLVFVWTIGF